MQRQMEEAQAKLEETEVTGTAGGGVVKVKINGKKEITEINIDKDAFDRDDEDLFEDIEENVMAAVNEAIRMQSEDEKEKMGKITGGLGGGFPF